MIKYPLSTLVMEPSTVATTSSIQQISEEGTAHVQQALGFCMAYILPVLSLFAVIAIVRSLFTYLSD
jgi:uncharacterized transporter YbjL